MRRVTKRLFTKLVDALERDRNIRRGPLPVIGQERGFDLRYELVNDRYSEERAEAYATELQARLATFGARDVKCWGSQSFGFEISIKFYPTDSDGFREVREVLDRRYGRMGGTRRTFPRPAA